MQSCTGVRTCSAVKKDRKTEDGMSVVRERGYNLYFRFKTFLATVN